MNILPNNKFLIALIVSAFMGISVVIISAVWLNKMDSLEMVQIVVSKNKLDPGSKLNKSNLKLTSWPKENLPVGAFINVDQLVNRTPKMDVADGEVILERMLIPVSSTGSLAVQISLGKRAFTLSVNEAAGVAGFAMPGNYVDVILNSKDQNNQEISKIIIHKILILAVAQDRLSDDSKPKVVSAITIEVTPSDAEKLDLARSIGTLSLVLRHQNEVEEGGNLGITRKDLVANVVNDIPVLKKPNKGMFIEVIRGLSKEPSN
jgi:pilus assembly protein CpaB